MSEYIANKELSKSARPQELLNCRPPIKPEQKPAVKPDPKDHTTWSLL